MPVTPTTPAQTDALAKLAEIPAVGSSEEMRWLEQAEMHGFDWPDQNTWIGTDKAILTLMSEARKQGQRDCLGASSETTGLSPIGHAPAGHKASPVDPSRGPLDEIADAYEARVATVPEAARRFAAETWGDTWAHAEMGSLLDFAALLVPAFAAAIPSGETGDPRVDSQVWTAARQLSPQQATQPEWLWFAQDQKLTTYGRWAKNSWQAPYVRADIALGIEARQGQDEGLVEDESPATSVATQEYFYQQPEITGVLAATPQPLPQSTPSQPEMTVEEAREVLATLPRYGLTRDWINWWRERAQYQNEADKTKSLTRANQVETALRILSSTPAAVLREPGKGGRS